MNIPRKSKVFAIAAISVAMVAPVCADDLRYKMKRNGIFIKDVVL
jgi:hypothetical protein